MLNFQLFEYKCIKCIKYIEKNLIIIVSNTLTIIPIIMFMFTKLLAGKSCIIFGCSNKHLKNSVACLIHCCKNTGCKNWREYDAFCYQCVNNNLIHKCHFDNCIKPCQNILDNIFTYMYCVDHAPKKCLYNKCQELFYGEEKPICQHHQCSTEGCILPIDSLVADYKCIEHTRYYCGICKEYGLCHKHKCYLCPKTVATELSKLCSLHKCMFCELVVDKNKTCIMHHCYMCSGDAITKDIPLCKEHKCRVGTCINETDGNVFGYCNKHKCSVPDCNIIKNPFSKLCPKHIYQQI